jgi:predicted acetyltransferase
MLNAIIWDGLLARIVDVDRALAQRPYSGAGRLTCEVQDDMAPWNCGRWQVETDGRSTTVRRTDRLPELTMPVATLAPLLFGHFSASQAARMGRLTAHEPSALPRWDALLRTAFPPGCGNGF